MEKKVNDKKRFNENEWTSIYKILVVEYEVKVFRRFDILPFIPSVFLQPSLHRQGQSVLGVKSCLKASS